MGNDILLSTIEIRWEMQAWHVDDPFRKIINLQLACQSWDMAAGAGGISPLWPVAA